MTGQVAGCRVCGSDGSHLIIELQGVPVTCNRLWSDREAALRAPVADILLHQCSACRHIFNARFDPGLVDYGAHYENSLEVSPRFEHYARDLAEALVTRLDLHGRTIVETGCGSGFFLKLLCNAGNNRGYGFDPERPHDRFLPSQRITYHAAPLDRQQAGLEPDLLVCRHVLEHIDSPLEFVTGLRPLLRADDTTQLFFEVPNGDVLNRGSAVWDLIYEHCSYFTSASLVHLFHLAGCRVRELYSGFDDQFLCIEASWSRSDNDSPQPASTGLTHAAVQLNESMARHIVRWRDRMEEIRSTGKKAVLWGAGSKGVTFLNLLQAGACIDAVVDINPLKQGCYVPVTGHSVIAPAELPGRGVDYVILMNPVYRDEVALRLRQSGVDAELLVV